MLRFITATALIALALPAKAHERLPCSDLFCALAKVFGGPPASIVMVGPDSVVMNLSVHSDGTWTLTTLNRRPASAPPSNSGR